MPSKIQASNETAKLSLEEQFLAMGLISEAQLQIAQLEKNTSINNRDIPSILVEIGWIKAQTVGFLKVVLPKMRARQLPGLKISDYLQQAGLISQSQVIKINQEVQNSSLSFSEAVVERGWVKQESIDFIGSYLNLDFPKRVEVKVDNDKDSLGEQLMTLLNKEIF